MSDLPASTPGQQHAQDNAPLDTTVFTGEPISIGEILSESWDCIDGYKMAFGIAASIYMGLYLLAVVIVAVAAGEHAANLVGLAFVPMTAAMSLMGIHMATGKPISNSMLFEHYDRFIPLVLLQLAITVLIMLGFLLLVIPGIYLATSYIFALPLMVEKNLGIWEALETSRKAVTRHWFSIFGLMFCMSAIMCISALPLGIGLIWTAPMMAAAIGVAYRRLFGVND